MMGFGGFGGMLGFGWLGMAVFWIALIALVVWAIISLVPGQREPVHETSLETLKRRYTRGDISASEYEQARKGLSLAKNDVGLTACK